MLVRWLTIAGWLCADIACWSYRPPHAAFVYFLSVLCIALQALLLVDDRRRARNG